MRHIHFIALLFLGQTLFSQPRYVNAAASGANNGTSWANAWTDLQSALAATGASEIWVAEGTYKPTSGTDRNLSFRLKSGMKLFGGFPTTGSPTWADRNPSTHETILSGDIGAADTSGNSYCVVRVLGGSQTVQLDGFTVTGGNADYSGGGVSASNTGFGQIQHLEIRNCVFRENYSGYEGAGADVNGLWLEVENCLFEKNLSDYSGAGLEIWGGYSIFGTEPRPVATVKNCVFQNNVSGNEGAGLNCGTAILNVEDTRFESNTGGGLDFFSEHFSHSRNDLLVNRCVFRDNSTDYSGGGFAGRGNCSFYNCLFENNRADDGGAAIHHFLFDTLNVVNSTFIGNEAQFGGGAITSFSWDSLIILNVANSVFYENSTPIFDLSDSPLAEHYLRSSLIQGSCPPGVNCSGAMLYNQDPKFVDDLAGDYRLRANSPCVNKGDNTALPPDITTDLDGHNRIAGGTVDMGAYEFGGMVGAVQVYEKGQFAQISPNPAGHGSSVQIMFEANQSSQSFDLEVLNAAGQTLIQKTGNTTNNGLTQHRLDTAALPGPGVYFVRVRVAGKSATTQKLVLTR